MLYVLLPDPDERVAIESLRMRDMQIDTLFIYIYVYVYI
jgi:hypothetical protein